MVSTNLTGKGGIPSPPALTFQLLLSLYLPTHLAGKKHLATATMMRALPPTPAISPCYPLSAFSAVLIPDLNHQWRLWHMMLRLQSGTGLWSLALRLRPQFELSAWKDRWETSLSETLVPNAIGSLPLAQQFTLTKFLLPLVHGQVAVELLAPYRYHRKEFMSNNQHHAALKMPSNLRLEVAGVGWSAFCWGGQECRIVKITSANHENRTSDHCCNEALCCLSLFSVLFSLFLQSCIPRCP